MTRGHQVHSWRLGVCLRTGDQLPTRVQACPSSSEPCSLQLLCVGLHVGRLLALQIGGSAPDQSRWAEILGLGPFSQWSPDSLMVENSYKKSFCCPNLPWCLLRTREFQVRSRFRCSRLPGCLRWLEGASHPERNCPLSAPSFCSRTSEPRPLTLWARVNFLEPAECEISTTLLLIFYILDLSVINRGSLKPLMVIAESSISPINSFNFCLTYVDTGPFGWLLI